MTHWMPLCKSKDDNLLHAPHQLSAMKASQITSVQLADHHKQLYSASMTGLEFRSRYRRRKRVSDPMSLSQKLSAVKMMVTTISILRI